MEPTRDTPNDRKSWLYSLKASSWRSFLRPRTLEEVDNCVSENKNHILLGYLGSLVGRGIIGSVLIQFMPVGHTHIKIDQGFSRLAVGCKHLNLFIREEQAAAFSASYKTLPVHTTTLRNLGNFKGVVLAEVKKINGISKPRAFCLRKDGEQRVTVGMKNFMHDEVFTGMPLPGVFSGEPHQLFIGSVPIVEDAPAFNLKPVKPETLRKIQDRYDSVHCRLKSLYPEDPAKRARIISEMNRSVTLLGEEGTKDWDLPRLHDFDNDDDSSADDSDDSSSADDSDDSSSADDTDDSSSDEQSSDAMDSSNGSGDSSPSASSGGSSSLRVEPDWFIVFPLELSNNNSLEVAKIVSVDSSAGDHGEVTVHWYTPSSRKKCSRAIYGKGVWSADYVMQDDKRVADLGTESIDLACYTFRALNKSQKLPFGVWAAVERCVPTGDASLSEGGGADDDSSEDEDEHVDGSSEEEDGRVDDRSEEEDGEVDDESEAVDEEGKGGEVGGGERPTSSISPSTAPAASAAAPGPAIPAARTTAAPPPAPRQEPNPNVPLTLAHFRQRRGGRAGHGAGGGDKEREDVHEDVQADDEGGTSGGERSASFMTSSAPAAASPVAPGPVTPPVPSDMPTSNVTLTLAHFRPRRGQIGE